MVALKNIAIIAIVSLVFGVTNAEVTTIFEESLAYPEHQLFFSNENLNSDNNKQLQNLTYALCQTSSLKFRMICQIMIHGKTGVENPCNVSIHADDFYDYPNVILAQIKVIPFGPQHVALLWGNESPPSSPEVKGEVKSTVVDLRTCKKEHQTLVSPSGSVWNSLKTSSIVIHEESFDVVLRKDSYSWKKINVNSKGIASEEIIYSNSLKLQLISDQRFNRYLQFDVGRRNLYSNVTIIEFDGSRRALPIISTNTLQKAVSTVNGIVRIALVSMFEEDWRVYIWRVAEYGSRTIESILHSKTIIDLAIYNLADGNYLLLTVEESDAGEKVYRVRNVDYEGHIIGELQVPGFEKRCSPYEFYSESIAIDENKAGDYCLSFVCSPTPIGWYYERSRLNLLVKCFTKQDLSLK